MDVHRRFLAAERAEKQVLDALIDHVVHSYG
jgi:hypothetical protein